jgi:hypothetical protein
MLKYENIKLVISEDWNELVEKTYNRPYNIQQQDGCYKPEEMVILNIPDQDFDDEMIDFIPKEENNYDQDFEGVKFELWLKDYEPKQFTKHFWYRSFYPDLQTVANDLCKKGLIEPGKYIIRISW